MASENRDIYDTKPGTLARLLNSLDNASTCSLLGTYGTQAGKNECQDTPKLPQKIEIKQNKCPLRLHLPEGSYKITYIFSGYTLQYFDTLFTFKSVLVIYFVMADASNKTHTFPVKSSQRRPSGKGSPPDFAAGNTFWHSGIDKPLKRMP